MIQPAESTVFPATEQAYSAIIERMGNRLIQLRSSSYEEPYLVTLLKIAEDLAERTDIRQSSRKLYSSAIIWYVRTHPSDDPAYDAKVLELATQAAKLKDLPGTARAKSSSKKISEEDLQALRAELTRLSIEPSHNGRHRTMARPALVWIDATLATGLRPVEWLSAVWTGDFDAELRVKTAKVKKLLPTWVRNMAPGTPAPGPGAVHGDQNVTEDFDTESMDKDAATLARDGSAKGYRVVPVSDSSPRAAVLEHLERLRAAADPNGNATEQQRLQAFKNYSNGCHRTILQACNNLWGDQKSFNLTTMRAQFAANSKAFYGAAITSRMMGHSGPTSPAAAHYGKGNQAHRRFKGGLRMKDIVGERAGQSAAPSAAPESPADAAPVPSPFGAAG